MTIINILVNKKLFCLFSAENYKKITTTFPQIMALIICFIQYNNAFMPIFL